jgi:seryl-tRNA synthetase
MACRKLESVGILEIIEKSGEARLFIGDHRLIEKLPDKTEKNRLSRDLEKFYREKQAERKTIDALRSMQEEKRKKINKQIEQQLKNKISEISSKKK